MATYCPILHESKMGNRLSLSNSEIKNWISAPQNRCKMKQKDAISAKMAKIFVEATRGDLRGSA